MFSKVQEDQEVIDQNKYIEEFSFQENNLQGYQFIKITIYRKQF